MTTSPSEPSTSWTVLAVPNWAAFLNVTLSVDTTAPAVVEAIEHAARVTGIRLVRE